MPLFSEAYIEIDTFPQQGSDCSLLSELLSFESEIRLHFNFILYWTEHRNKTKLSNLSTFMYFFPFGMLKMNMNKLLTFYCAL